MQESLEVDLETSSTTSVMKQPGGKQVVHPLQMLTASASKRRKVAGQAGVKDCCLHSEPPTVPVPVHPSMQTLSPLYLGLVVLVAEEEPHKALEPSAAR